MNDEARPDRRLYGRFLVQALGLVAVLIAAGYLPTRRLGGEAAVAAMLVACGITLVGSLAGTVPVFVARRLARTQAVPAVLGAIALRLALVLAGALAAALSGLVAPAPLIVWLVVSHVGLLVPDTVFATAVLAGGREEIPTRANSG